MTPQPIPIYSGVATSSALHSLQQRGLAAESGLFVEAVDVTVRLAALLTAGRLEGVVRNGAIVHNLWRLVLHPTPFFPVDRRPDGPLFPMILRFATSHKLTSKSSSSSYRMIKPLLTDEVGSATNVVDVRGSTGEGIAAMEGEIQFGNHSTASAVIGYRTAFVAVTR
jgi:hypothetical protein